MRSITDWLVENGIAKHWKQAENITRLLHLGELYNAKKFDEIRARAKLYRDLRTAGFDRPVAAERAIAGDPIPALECHCNAEHAYMTYIPHEEGCPLFNGVLHSEK